MLIAGCVPDDVQRPTGGTGTDPSLLVERGRQLFLRSQLDSAIAQLELARTIAADRQDRQAQSDALVWLAYSLWQSGSLSEADARARDALELKLDHGLGGAWRAYNVRGLVAWWESRNTDALDLFERALAVVPEGEEEAVATVEANRSLILFEFGDFEGARDGFEIMRDYGARSGDSRLEGNALINLAMLDVQGGDPASAVPLLERARRLHEAVGSVTGVEFSVGHLATAYAAMGELGRAYATFDTALAITRENGLRAEEAENLAQLAGLHADADDVQRALDLYAESRAIDEKIGLEDRVATNLREEAVLLSTLGNLPEALRRAEQAWRIHSEVDTRLEAERDLIVLAELAQRRGDGQGADGYLAEARRVSASVDARVARAAVALAEARIGARASQPERVLRALDRAAPDLVGGSYAAEWEAESLRADALRRLGRLAEAEVAGRRAVEVTDRVRGGFASGALRSSFTAARLDTYATLVSILLSEGRPEEALEVSDGVRARSLGMGGPGGAEGETLLRTVESLVESLDTYLNDASPEARETAEELARRLARAREQYERFLIRRDEGRGGRTASTAWRVAAADVRSVLDEREVALEYLVTPERLLVFAVDSEGVRVIERQITAENLTSRIRLARELLSRPEGGERARAVLGGLHELLIAPLIATGILAGKDRILVIPHEALTYLPFGVLLDPVTGRYLVEDFAVAHASSAASVVALRRRAGSQPSTSGGAALAPFPDELLASRDEALAVATAVGARPLVGSEATEGMLRRVLREGGVVHLATHGVMNPLNPMFSRMELAAGGEQSDDDGRLEVHELLDLSITADLVFLSGCETALGATWSTDFALGEDYATLSDAFLLAGAHNVVATLWRLQDPGAARFAELFYEALNGRSPVEALAHAQRAMLRDPEWASPFHWAAYQVTGAG